MTQHFPRPTGEPTATDYGPPDWQPDFPTLIRLWIVHGFIVLLEGGLLVIQYLRMEALAFDVLPELADANLGIIYGSALLGGLWVMVVIFVSYVTWEITIRVQERGGEASWALRAGCVAFWLFNVAAMIFEFQLFRMLVNDFNTLGIAGEAEIFGALMVAVHQAASFWIVRNIVRQIFVDDEVDFAPEDEKDL